MKTLTKPLSQILISLSVAGVMLLAGCSAHVSGGDSGTPADTQANFMDPRPTITGPTVEGHWMSACNGASSQSGYRMYDVTFKGNTVVRNEALFSDPSCANSSGKLNYHGRFRFIGKNADGSYNIEYAFDLGGGVTTFPQENISVANNQLLVSEFAAGSIGYLQTSEPLLLVGTTPASTSTNVAAQQVSSYADAKYAFCEAQGYGVMIDFMGSDLSKSGNGSARIGSKACGSSSEIKWNAKNVSYNVDATSGTPQITFPDSQYGDYIKPYGYQNGLASKSGAHTLLYGNSGECYFLKNAGTLNLDFTYSCH